MFQNAAALYYLKSSSGLTLWNTDGGDGVLIFHVSKLRGGNLFEVESLVSQTLLSRLPFSSSLVLLLLLFLPPFLCSSCLPLSPPFPFSSPFSRRIQLTPKWYRKGDLYMHFSDVFGFLLLVFFLFNCSEVGFHPKELKSFSKQDSYCCLLNSRSWVKTQ